MKILHRLCAVATMMIAITGCDKPDERDLVPDTFFMMQLNPDDIHMYNSGDSQVRLDPLLNDSLKVDATISYSAPLHGKVSFIQNEGWFYNPDEGFFGIDNIVYTVCHAKECGSASITMYVEEPLDENTCVFEINGESIHTLVDHPIEIRIFDNDVICQYQGMSLDSPEKGQFTSFSYSGSYKNTVYVYYPPKGFKGTDRFRYRVFTSDGTVTAYCEITIE